MPRQRNGNGTDSALSLMINVYQLDTSTVKSMSEVFSVFQGVVVGVGGGGGGKSGVHGCAEKRKRGLLGH